jgi:hypothetical protein
MKCIGPLALPPAELKSSKEALTDNRCPSVARDDLIKKISW